MSTVLSAGTESITSSSVDNSISTSTIPPINRSSLQLHLVNLRIDIHDDDLQALTEEQADELWYWMEEFENLEDPENQEPMFNGMPEFLAIGDSPSEGGFKHIVLKDRPADATATDASAEGSPPAPAPAADHGAIAERHLALIKQASNIANARRADLNEAESEVRAAKAREKECREKLDRAEVELSRVIADMNSGQQQLPFDDVPIGQSAANAVQPESAVAGGDEGQKVSEHAWSIEELSSKSIKSLVGDERFDLAKDQEDPIGLTDSMIEKLIEAELDTVQKLETRIREDAFWMNSISGIGKKGVDRITSTIVAFRSVRPVPASE